MKVEEESKMEYLYIPTNVRRRKEIVEGIGTEEIIKIVIVTLIGFLVSGIVYLVYQQIVAFVVIPPVMAGLAFTVLKKNRVNYSALDLLCIIKEFYRQQNRFLYQYYDQLHNRNQ